MAVGAGRQGSGRGRAAVAIRPASGGKLTCLPGGDVQTLAGLGQRDPALTAVGGQVLDRHGVGDTRRIVPSGPPHHVGQAVLAGHRRLFQRPRQCDRVGLAGRAAAVRADLGPAPGPTELPGQRPVLVATGGVRGRRRRQSGGQGLRPERVLGGHRHAAGDRSRLHLQPASRHLPHPAFHHPLAGVAHRPAQRRLARRRRVLPRQVPGASDRQSRPAHPARHRLLHRIHRAGPECAHLRHPEHASFRRDQRDGVGGGIHPDPVEPLRSAHALRRHHRARTVLDSPAVRVRHHGDRVLDRASSDPVQLPQRTHQRGFPLRPGPDARCSGVDQLLPR